MPGPDLLLLFFLVCVFFQESCLPIFCPSFSMSKEEQCEHVVTKLHTHGIMLVLRSISIDAIIPAPRYIKTIRVFNPEDMARSDCLDFDWSQMTVVAEYYENTNVTHALSIYLIKLFNNEKGFSFSQMLTKYAKCFPSAWEILINGQWVQANMSFTSGVLNGRMVSKSAPIGIPANPERSSLRLYKSYQITKLDYCQQVNI